MVLHTLLPSPSVVIEICSALRSSYPDGDGSAVIFRSMPANNRRVRWLWFTEGFDTADLKDAKALLDELSA
jgi:hypothetical protein